MKIIKNRMEHVLPIIMDTFTRDKLREIAANNGIKRGRDKADTANNILNDSRVVVTFTVCIETVD